MEKELRIIISGGGTGGHIFPAVSIANAIIELRPDAEILFVGAEGRMKMQRVPDAGYRIIGLPIAGFDRKHLWKNVSVLIKLMRSQWKARKVIKNFRPQVAVGVGGYASGPTLKTAGMMGVPTLIQEQNSYAGVTNKLLAQKARKFSPLTARQKDNPDCRWQLGCTHHQQHADSQSDNHQGKHGRAVYLANGQILLPASNRSRKSGRSTSEFICNGFHQRYGSRLCSSRSGYLPCGSRFHF